jgi:hypothetical protein
VIDNRDGTATVTCDVGSSAVFPFGFAPVSFSYSGAIQTYTVPEGAHALYIEALGASGGDASTYTGGHGAAAISTISVTPGDVLHILVGQQPPPIDDLEDGCGASGGGGTFVVRGTVEALVVAGGGGGASGFAPGSSYSENGQDASLVTDGLPSGPLLGGMGGLGGEGGGAANQEGGGGGGVTGDGGSGTAIGGAAFANGGAGGARDDSESCGSTSPGGFGGGGGGGNDLGGGGGGYSGGAAAESAGTSPGAGGGGSFALGLDSSISVRTTHGHGQVVIVPHPF